jgi:hypothetical protein
MHGEKPHIDEISEACLWKTSAKGNTEQHRTGWLAARDTQDKKGNWF